MEGKKKVKAVSFETFVFLFIFIGGFSWLGHKMGVGNMFKTMIAPARTAIAMIRNTVDRSRSCAVAIIVWSNCTYQ